MTDRAIKMKNLRLRGHTLQEIAETFGVTKEWVRRSILSVSKEEDRERFAAALARRKAVRGMGRASTYRDMLRVALKAGTTPKRLFQDNGLDPQALEEAKHQHVRDLLRRPHARQTFSDEEILQALKGAAERADASSLSSGTYGAHRREGDPSYQLIAGRFGSWNEAISRTGLTPINGPHGDSPHQVWSRDAILDSVVEFFRREGWDGSMDLYDKWAEGRDLPSASVVRSRLGGWSEARLEALPVLLDEGSVLVSGESWSLDDFPSDVLRLVGWTAL